jgi:hypothetical protein
LRVARRKATKQRAADASAKRRIEGMDSAKQFLDSRRKAAIQNMHSSGLRFFATPAGTLIFETRDGALDKLDRTDAVALPSTDPTIRELLSSNDPTGIYIVLESERDFCRDLRREEQRRGAVEVWFFPKKQLESKKYGPQLTGARDGYFRFGQ